MGDISKEINRLLNKMEVEQARVETLEDQTEDLGKQVRALLSKIDETDDMSDILAVEVKNVKDALDTMDL